VALVDLPYDRDLVAQSGTTFQFLLRYLPGGQPVDWAGWEAWMPIGRTYEDPLLELTVGNGIDFQPNGVLYIYMPVDQTSYIGALDIPKRSGTGTLRYNLMLKDPMGATFMFMRGKLFIELNVRRPK
jgi:hypothetical protein